MPSAIAYLDPAHVKDVHLFDKCFNADGDQQVQRVRFLDSMKPIFKNHSLQNIFVLIVGYFGLMFVRQAIGYWNDEEWFATALNGGFAYALFGSLLGFPPMNKIIK